MTKASHQSEQTPQSLFDELPKSASRNYRDGLKPALSASSTPYQTTLYAARTMCSVCPADKELITRYSDEVKKTAERENRKRRKVTIQLPPTKKVIKRKVLISSSM